MVNISQLYLEIRSQLSINDDMQSASLQARNLLCTATGLKYEQLLAVWNQPASHDICATVASMKDRILAGEPLAYVLGEWDFYGLTLHVDRNVLIPRDDTCAVTDLAIRQALFLGQAPRILDLCCGSGCIGLAIAENVKDARVTLADISPEAISIAKKNVQRCKLGGRVNCVQANALEESPTFLGKFDLIVSNPPYITTAQMGELEPSVKDFEPHLALHGGNDGLDFYRAIVMNYAYALKPDGYLCFEFGYGQGNDICRILQANQYDILDRTVDYNGIERAVIAQYRRKDD